MYGHLEELGLEKVKAIRNGQSREEGMTEPKEQKAFKQRCKEEKGGEGRARAKQD